MTLVPHASSTPTSVSPPSGAHVVRGTGIALLVLGFAAIILPQAATLATELLVGSLLLLSGIAGLVLTTSTHGVFGRRSLGLVSVLTLLAGAFLLAMPSAGERALTAMLAALFLVEGVLYGSLGLRLGRASGVGASGAPGAEASSGRLWLIASGVTSLLVGVLILAGWPASAGWAIGLLMGVKLIATGAALTALGGALRAFGSEARAHGRS